MDFNRGGVVDIDVFYSIKDLVYLIMLEIRQIIPFWVSGIVFGAIISVYGREAVFHFVLSASKRKYLFIKLVIAAVLGAISPITMFGMLPILLLLSEHKINQGILASFIVTSALINPNVFIYSFALGTKIALLRLLVCIIAGVFAGMLVNYVFKRDFIFELKSFEQEVNEKYSKPRPAVIIEKINKSIFRTAPNLLLGMLLAALFQLYFPQNALNYLFMHNRGLGVLFSASLGVPVYYCGGGTIPLIKAWMFEGMSIGAVMAFMITGPGTKITNLAAIKVMLPGKKFIYYILYNIAFGIVTGFAVDFIHGLIG